MFAWLTSLLTFFAGLFSAAAPAPEHDYGPEVSVEMAYSALMPRPVVTKPKVPQKDCKTCNGTGRVRSGDDQGWTKCPDCEPARDAEGSKSPADAPKEKLTTPPAQGWPARTTPSVSECPGGTCPVSAYQFYRV